MGVLGRLGRPRNLLLLHVALAAAAFFSFGGYRNEPAKVESDGKYYYQFLLSVWFDGDLDFSNNYQQARKPFMVRDVDHYDFGSRLTATGLPVNMFTTGPAVLWSPFFVVTYGVGSALSAAGGLASPPDGWEMPFQLSVMFAAVVYSALTLVLLYQMLLEHFDRRVVVTGLGLAFWGTNWAYYCIFEPSMSHVYDLFTLVLLMRTCLHAARRGGSAAHLAVGISAGLHVLVRTQNIVTVLLLLAFFWLVPSVGDGRRVGFSGRPRHAAVLLVALVGALLPLVISNLTLFGDPFVIPQAHDGRFLRLASPNLFGVLFSARNGLFSHHPVLLLAVAGIFGVFAGWRSHRDLLLRLLLPLGLVFLCQLWINAAAVDWWGGHAFGQRRLMSSLPLFAIGLCALQQIVEKRLGAGRWVVLATVSLAVALNIYLMMIHVFAWSYDEPHDILDWLFVRGPAWVASRFTSG